MIKKQFKVNTDYDYSLDIYTITVDEEFEFGKSLEIDDGVILDFDNENIPISIEILDISKKLAIKKDDVKSSRVSMRIICTPEILEVSIVFFYESLVLAVESSLYVRRFVILVGSHSESV